MEFDTNGALRLSPFISFICLLCSVCW